MTILDGEVLRHDLQPGDVIILRVRPILSLAQVDQVKNKLCSEFPGHKCLVISDDMQLEIVRPKVQE